MIRELMQRSRARATQLAGERGRYVYRTLRYGVPNGTAASPPTVVYVNHPSGTKPRVLGMQYPPPGYLGQLDDDFQRRMAIEREFVELDDCYFYHASTLPDGTEVAGPWDLRGHENEYLGGIDLRGKRVLELGPATGHMSFYMEKAGAEVVSFDAGFDVPIDIIPWHCADMTGIRMEQTRLLSTVQNSWWYLHRARESKVKMVYGNIYKLPGDLGQFDVSTFQAILLHLRDPYSALEQAARRTRHAIVVSESVDPSIESSDAMRFFPTRIGSFSTGWWSFSPGTIEAMLQSLGFANLKRTEHFQVHHPNHEMSDEPVKMKMFTVVGTK